MSEKILDFEDMMKQMGGDGPAEEGISDTDEDAILSSKLGKDKMAMFQNIMQSLMGGFPGMGGDGFPSMGQPEEEIAIPVKVKILEGYEDSAIMPTYAHEGDACFDFYAADDITLAPGETTLVPTGLAVAIEPGFYMTVVPRSGKSLKTSLRLANSPGTVDSGYRGHVQIIAWNSSATETIKIKKGDRIAQGGILPILKAAFTQVDDLDATERAEGGFGSTDEVKEGEDE